MPVVIDASASAGIPGGHIPASRRLRAGINARLIYSPELRGFNRYTVNLLSKLSEQGVQLVLYSDQAIHADYLQRLQPGSYVVRVSSPLPYPAWEQIWLPRQCEADRVDVLHSPFNFGLPWASACPRVLTLHDAIDQVYYRPMLGWAEKWNAAALKTRLYHWHARTRAHQVITVSQHAKEQLVRCLGLPAGKISVVYEAADPCFERPVSEGARTTVRKKYNLFRPYFFYVGGWEKRKNVPFLLRAFAAAAVDGLGADGPEIVLAGGNPDQQDSLKRLARELSIQDRVYLLGWVDETDLPALYAGALAFVYPSEHEGFGLQLCEAMASGCPVLAARATSLPEVLGSGGDTFALEDSGRELAALLRRVGGDDGYRRDLVERGRARSGQLSWRRAAEQTIRVYERALAENGPRAQNARRTPA